MYKQIKTSDKIVMSKNKSEATPIATLQDEYGGTCQIINDDNCYVVCLKKQDDTYSPTTHIFKEAFQVLVSLSQSN